MAGVRAGLNGMDEGKMASSLSGTTECASHPDGARRVQAIEAGVTFAHEYMESHNGTPPSFSDCLEHFERILINADTSDIEAAQINLRPEGTMAALSDTQTDGNDTNEDSLKAYSQDEIKRKMAKADKERRYHEGMVEQHTYMAKNNLGPADLQSHLNEVKAHQREVEHWKSEYQKWKWTKPDPIK